jgi:hypothetical protein
LGGSSKAWQESGLDWFLLWPGFWPAEKPSGGRRDRWLDFFGGSATANLAVMTKETAGMFALEKVIR